MAFPSRERRSYRAVIPTPAWQHGCPPRQRGRRRRAFGDLADGLERYLRNDAVTGARAEWAAWAVRLAADERPGQAPDGTQWHVKTAIDYE